MRNLLVRIAAAVTVAGTGAIAADPAAEIASFSVFKQVDMAKLAKGDVILQSGPSMKFGRGLSVEALYVLPMSPARANEMQQKWDGSRHSELKIFLHGELSRRPGAKEFQRIASAPQNSSVRNFVSAMEKLNPEKPELQMTAAEARGFDKSQASGKGMPPGVATFWMNLLGDRAEAFARGGLPALPPYATRGGGAVRAVDDASELIKERPAIRKQFSALLASMTGGGGGSPSFFYEMFDVEGRAAIALGATFSRPVGDSIQTGTVQYYASDGYYVMLSLSQMWPVQVDGKQATLVWRGDLLSSNQLGELRGIERAGSSVAMRKEIQKTLNAMVNDLSSGH